jgi:hypothetical protein
LFYRINIYLTWPKDRERFSHNASSITCSSSIINNLNFNHVVTSLPNLTKYVGMWFAVKRKVEDVKVVIRSHISKDRQIHWPKEKGQIMVHKTQKSK